MSEVFFQDERIMPGSDDPFDMGDRDLAVSVAAAHLEAAARPEIGGGPAARFLGL